MATQTDGHPFLKVAKQKALKPFYRPESRHSINRNAYLFMVSW